MKTAIRYSSREEFNYLINLCSILGCRGRITNKAAAELDWAPSGSGWIVVDEKNLTIDGYSTMPVPDGCVSQRADRLLKLIRCVAIEVADQDTFFRVCSTIPGRFLFGAGQTPAQWYQEHTCKDYPLHSSCRVVINLIEERCSHYSSTWAVPLCAKPINFQQLQLLFNNKNNQERKDMRVAIQIKSKAQLKAMCQRLTDLGYRHQGHRMMTPNQVYENHCNDGFKNLVVEPDKNEMFLSINPENNYVNMSHLWEMEVPKPTAQVKVSGHTVSLTKGVDDIQIGCVKTKVSHLKAALKYIDLGITAGSLESNYQILAHAADDVKIRTKAGGVVGTARLRELKALVEAHDKL